MANSSLSIAITGFGIVSSLGVGVEAFNSAVRQKKSSIAELTLFEPPGNCEYAAEVEYCSYDDAIFSTQPYVDRATSFALVAAREALEQAAVLLPYAENESCEIGLCLGTCWGCMESADKFIQPVIAGKAKSAQGLLFMHSFVNSAASLIAIEFGLRGFSTVSAGSRLAGFWALASAYDAITSGMAERILVGATEALSLPVFAHYQNLNLLSFAGEVLPFNDKVNATVLGEGSVFLLLERVESAKARNAEVLCILQECVLAGEASSLVVTKKDFANVYTCAPGLKKIDLLEQQILKTLVLNEQCTLLPLHGDVLAVNPLFALADSLTSGSESMLVLQASEEGAAFAALCN